MGKIEHYRFLVPVAVSCLLIIASCKKKNDTYTGGYHYDYAPMDSGHYVIYDVDSISYAFISPIVVIDSAHYQLKEEIGDTVDLNNETWRELNRYRRADATSPWVFDRKWTVRRTATSFLKNEGDHRYVKLVFPPAQDETWNGNIYLPQTDNYKVFLDWDYHYGTVHQPYSINGLSFDSTLVANEVNDTLNLVQRRVRNEVYAKGVGMIYQEWEVLDKQNITGNWQTGNLDGFRIRMRVIDHN